MMGDVVPPPWEQEVLVRGRAEAAVRGVGGAAVGGAFCMSPFVLRGGQ